MKKKCFYLIYIIAFTIICFLPSMLTPLFKTENTAEKRKLSEFPELKTDDGKINTNWTKEFDTYFSEHFAFRSDLVKLNSQIMASVFSSSAENDVIIGKNGWLYFSETADDFTGLSELEQWEVDDIAHIIKMMEAYAEACGTQMIFTSVPNKNTIYPEYMPYNYIKNSNLSNLNRLEAAMSQQNINYCSLTEILGKQKAENPDRLLYHKTDTHWNNYGAFTAYSAISEKLGSECLNIDKPGTIENNWTGDLQEMIFPNSDCKDAQVNYNLNNTYTYVGRFRGLDDLSINTICPNRNGKLLMFRDSFGEAILPFMAESFGAAQFSRTIPYSMNMLETGQYSCAVLEIVERNISNIRKTAPLMPAPECESITEYTLADSQASDCRHTQNGDYTKVYGKLDSDFFANKSRKIYAVINGKTYEAFPIYEEELLGCDDKEKHGYSLLIKDKNITEAEVIVETDTGFVSTGKLNINK